MSNYSQQRHWAGTRGSAPSNDDHERSGPPAMTLVLLEESDSRAQRGNLANMAGLLSALHISLQPVAVADMPATTDIGDLYDEKEAASAGLHSDRVYSIMAGRYLGQIDARVERVWIRPRSPIDSGLFACRVRIVQGNDGRVQEIEMVQCNGDVAWQASLVRAIQSASPLPAPPDPKVFSRILILEFLSTPYLPGTDTEGFEPEPRTAVQ